MGPPAASQLPVLDDVRVVSHDRDRCWSTTPQDFARLQRALDNLEGENLMQGWQW